jgi:hypothetical protein
MHPVLQERSELMAACLTAPRVRYRARSSQYVSSVPEERAVRLHCHPIGREPRVVQPPRYGRASRPDRGQGGGREAVHPVPVRPVPSPYVWVARVESQIRRLVRRPVTVAAVMTRTAATMMLMIHRIQSMPLVASTPRAAAT